jgi:FdrA protein
VLGVGGRDLSAEVGGRSAVQALRALDEDPATELIVLVSKPPAPEVARAVRDLDLATPVVAALLGPGQDDLTTAAEKVLRALGRDVPEWPSWPAPARAGRRDAAATLRGLYAGGTLCAEAALVAGTGEFTDFGDDAYTQGRAHPMIDPALRLEALRGVASGVVLMDVVLGHGADPDPSSWLAPAIGDAAARGVDVVVAVVGTDGDPQGLRAQAARLSEAGAAVFTSNAAAARHARLLAGG